MDKPYRIIGVEASPYSVKVRAYLRYRRVPYIWVSRMPQFFDETKNLKPVIMPVVQFPDGAYRIDSTPIIEDIETTLPADRSIIPDDPKLAYYCHLIEDFADEWLAKCLFHYRFSYDDDRIFGPRWVMDDSFPQADVEELDERHQFFLDRQTQRMPLVGCTPANKDVLEDSFVRLLEILEPFVALEKFLFGSRPSLADFGLYGQLQTLATDPTPRKLMRDLAPRLENWVRRLGDLSGVDGDFVTYDELDPAVLSIIELAEEIYIPYLHANKKALDDGDEDFRVQLGKFTFQQPTFRYHKKCIDRLSYLERQANIANDGTTTRG